MKIVDLSQPLSNDMPIFPQDPDFFLEEKFKNQDHGFSLSLLKTGLHAGTHIDAPYHFYSSGRKIDKISLEELIGPVKIVDINPNKTKPNNLEDMVNLEIKISDFKNVKKGDRVIVNTGWSKKWGSVDYFSKNPYLSPEVAEFLVKKKILGLGIDGPSVDPLGKTDIHKKILFNDIWIIENLTRLEEIIKYKKSHSLEFFFIPLPIVAEASPVRVFARIKK